MTKCRFIVGAFLIVVVSIYLFSCTTIDTKYTKDNTPTFKEKMDGLIGVLTYDQALMTWGEPTSTFDGDEIFLATWGRSKSGGAIFPINTTWFALPIESGWKLQLSFNRATRKLASWKYEKW